MPTVTLHDQMIVNPSEPEGGMSWLDDREYAVLLYRMRCSHGCTGRMRQAVPRALLADRQAWPGYVNGLPFHAEQAHVCLRKAVVGHRHVCALCGWVDVVNRLGQLRRHVRLIVATTFEEATRTEACPGAEMQPGRRW